MYTKDYLINQRIPKLWEIDFKDWFTSTDPNCPAYQYELLSPTGSTKHDPMFSIDEKKFDVSFGIVPVGTYSAMLHPTSHSYAQSLPI